MPVVAATKCWSELARRSDVAIAVQDMANLVRILFMNTSERQIGKPLRRLGIEIWRSIRSKCTKNGNERYKCCDSHLGQSFRRWSETLSSRLIRTGGVSKPPRSISLLSSNELVKVERWLFGCAAAAHPALFFSSGATNQRPNAPCHRKNGYSPSNPFRGNLPTDSPSRRFDNSVCAD